MYHLINFLIDIQNKILNKQTSKKSNKLVDGVSLCLNAKTNLKRENFEKEIKDILKKNNNDILKLINYIKANGTNVYKFSNAQKIMKNISQEIGFIPKTKGIKAFLISFIIKCNVKKEFEIKSELDEMIILDSKNIDTMWFIQQFYKWYAMKNNMPGYSQNAQENFNSLMLQCTDSKIKNLSVDEIFDLKDAIARDLESINFVMEYTRQTFDSKKALKKIISGGASI